MTMRNFDCEIEPAGECKLNIMGSWKISDLQGVTRLVDENGICVFIIDGGRAGMAVPKYGPGGYPDTWISEAVTRAEAAAPDAPAVPPRLEFTEAGLKIREDALAEAVDADNRHCARGPETRVRAVLEAVFGKVEVV